MIVDNKKESQSLSVQILKKLLIDWIAINGNEDTQKPPTRYNDASLINKMDPKNLNIGRPSTYASIIEKIISRKYVEIKDIAGKEVMLNKYNIKKTNPKSMTLETKGVIIGKERKKLVPTELGKNATDFLEKYFSKLMDYGFTANMEKQLDDVAEGKLDKLKIIKPFYDYVQEQIKTVVPVNIQANSGNKYKSPEKIGTHDNIDITLCDGPYGQYVTYNNSKFNLKTLFEEKPKDDIDDMEAELKELEDIENGLETNKTKSKIIVSKKSNKSNKFNDSDDEYDEYNENNENSGSYESQDANFENGKNSIELCALSNEEILEKVIEKIESLKQSVSKEWKIGKKKYILKTGKYGHYVEEWNITTKKKLDNYTIKYLMSKIAKNNNIDVVKDENKVIELISEKDIQETVEYNSKNKKSTSGKYVKK
jgi:DNA topoisomerase-1